MKILLAVMMSMVVSVSAFAACSPTTLKECTKEQCEGLTEPGTGNKYSYVETAPLKCMVKAPAAKVTDCKEANDSHVNPGTAGAPGAGGTDKKAKVE
jgi:hypothetical protein